MIRQPGLFAFASPSRLAALGGLPLPAAALVCVLGAAPAAAQVRSVVDVTGVSVDAPLPSNGGPARLGFGARLDDLFGEDEVVARLGASTRHWWAPGAGRAYANQGRFALGAFVSDRTYVLGGIDADFDGLRDGERKLSARAVQLGGELGRYFSDGRGRVELLAGLTAGVAFVGGVTGREPAAYRPGRWVDRSFDATVPALGASVAGRFGREGARGAVQVIGAGARLGSVGNRLGGQVDVNLAAHLKAGAGVRRVSLQGPAGEVRLSSAYVAVTVSR